MKSTTQKSATNARMDTSLKLIPVLKNAQKDGMNVKKHIPVLNAEKDVFHAKTEILVLNAKVHLSSMMDNASMNVNQDFMKLLIKSAKNATVTVKPATYLEMFLNVLIVKVT